MAKSESLEDLKRIATAKHGEDWAYTLASRFDNPNHKASWRKAIAEPARSLEQTLDHQAWQRDIQMCFFGRTFLPQEDQKNRKQ